MIYYIQRNKDKDVAVFLTKPMIAGRQQSVILKVLNE